MTPCGCPQHPRKPQRGRTLCWTAGRRPRTRVTPTTCIPGTSCTPTPRSHVSRCPTRRCPGRSVLVQARMPTGLEVPAFPGELLCLRTFPYCPAGRGLARGSLTGPREGEGAEARRAAQLEAGGGLRAQAPGGPLTHTNSCLPHSLYCPSAPFPECQVSARRQGEREGRGQGTWVPSSWAQAPWLLGSIQGVGPTAFSGLCLRRVQPFTSGSS